MVVEATYDHTPCQRIGSETTKTRSPTTQPETLREKITWYKNALVRIESKNPTALAARKSWIVRVVATAKILEVNSKAYIEIKNNMTTIVRVTIACGSKK